MKRAVARTVVAAALAVVIASIAGCASQAPMRQNDPGTRPVAGSDEDELWYAMERAEEDLARSPLRVRDPALNAYVKDVACRASAGYCNDLRVYIMNVPAFNASMAPNGTMIVWTGALLRMRDEAELAFVLGHEAGHFRAQHTLRQWRRMKDTSAFLSAFQVLAYGAGFPNTAMFGSLGVYATIFKFSRDMEREADKLGFDAVVAQGWDPRAGADLWARMLREENTLKYVSRSTVFATHPATQERLNDVNAAADAIPNPPTTRNTAQYRAATRPFLENWIVGELAQRRYASSMLVIQELLDDAPPEDRGLLTFYLGEAHRKHDGPGDDAQAADLYARAVTMPGTPIAAWREHGYALAAAGRNDEARVALGKYLQSSPQADDRAFVQRTLDKLGDTN
ncbi:MAG: M48 family metalloprotease [Lysobacter sp.]|nr:M48 family metalloprotease [Lysobacter sp.]